MLESIFIITVVIGFIIYLLALMERSWPLCVMSTMIWLFIALNSVRIDLDTSSYVPEYGFSAFSYIFMFTSIVFTALFLFEERNLPGQY